MRTLKFWKIFIFLCIFASSSLATSGKSWWGEGYRPPEWVLSHGGTIIYFEIAGYGTSNKYKAVMEKNGRYVEGEIGKKGKFDDAKNGVYEITAYKGGEDNRSGKTGEKIVSVKINARPGETIRLFFSEEKESVSVRSDSPVPAPNSEKKKDANPLPSLIIPESARKEVRLI